MSVLPIAIMPNVPKCRHVDLSLGLNYTHSALAAILVRPVAVAADVAVYANVRD